MADVINFYSVSDDFGCFSNFAPYPVRMGGKLWPTSEHYFQAQKFEEAEHQERIRETKSPMIAARMGRDRKKRLRRDWESVKVAIMRDVVRAKFSQHDDIRQILLSTGDAKIVEHTENDSYWGDGGDGSGKKHAGAHFDGDSRRLEGRRGVNGVFWPAEGLPMAGGWETYRCERCPLTIELGGSTLWDQAGVVHSETAQVACRACGTMHRVTEDRGECRVTALPGPVRVALTQTLRDVSGEEHQVEYWVAEGDWQVVGPFTGGIAATAELPCSYCGRAAGMLTLSGVKLPFHVAMAGGRVECPVCRGPMECIGVSDAI